MSPFPKLLRTGAEFQVTVFDLPQDLAVLMFGWKETLPTPLGAHGMPGCDAHITSSMSVFVVGSNGNACWMMSIPNDRSLVGRRLSNQALVVDAGANALGAVFSDAARGTIGTP